MADATRTLIVLRHSKAEGYAERDSARRLSERGHRDAAAAGRFLAEAGLVPDHVLVSAAERTKETWSQVHDQVGGDPLVDLTWDLYDAGPEEVLRLLRGVPEDAATVLFVGHNPTAAGVAFVVDDGAGDAQAQAVLDEGFSTSALAVFQVEVPWGDVGEGTGRLTHGHVGRG